MWCLHDLEMANVWRSGQNAAESLSCSDFHCTDFRYQQSGTASAEQVSQLLPAKTCLSPVSRSFTSLSYPYSQRQVLFPVTAFSALLLHSSWTTPIIVVTQAPALSATRRAELDAPQPPLYESMTLDERVLNTDLTARAASSRLTCHFG